MSFVMLIGARLIGWCFDRQCWEPILKYFTPSRSVTAESTDKTFTPGKTVSPLPDK